MNLEKIKNAAQSLKDKVLYKSPLEKHLNEATNDENWTTPTKTLSEIADHTYSYNDFSIIMKFIWEKLNSKNKKWKKILKSLNLIEYLLKNGAPRCVGEFKDEIYQLRTLQDFTAYENNIDRGASIREKAKQIIELLTDDQKLDQERENAKKIKDRLSSMGSQAMGSDSNNNLGPSNGYGGISSDAIAKKYQGYGGTTNYVNSSAVSSTYDKYDRYDKWQPKKKEDTEEPPKDNKLEKESNYKSPFSNTSSVNITATEEKTAVTTASTIKIPKPGEKLQAVQQPQSQQVKPPTQFESLIDIDQPPTQPQNQGQANLRWDALPSQQQESQVQQTITGNNNIWGFGAQPINPGVQQQTPVNQPADAFNQGSAVWSWNNQTTAPTQTSTITGISFPSVTQQPQVNPIVNTINNQPLYTSQTLTKPAGGSLNQINFAQQPNLAQQVQKPITYANNTQQSSAPTNLNDGFEDFVTATAESKPEKNEYKNYSVAEAGLVNLNDLLKDNSAHKKEAQSKTPSKSNNQEPAGQNLLYSTKEDLDNFLVSPSRGPAGFNTMGAGGMMGMNTMNSMNSMNTMNKGMMPNMMNNMGTNPMMGMGGGMNMMGPMGMSMPMNNMGMNPMMMNNMGMNPMMNMGMNPMNMGMNTMGTMGMMNTGMGPMGGQQKFGK